MFFFSFSYQMYPVLHVMFGKHGGQIQWMLMYEKIKIRSHGLKYLMTVNQDENRLNDHHRGLLGGKQQSTHKHKNNVYKHIFSFLSRNVHLCRGSP